MEIPVACRLDPPAARSQMAAWGELLGDAVARSDRVAPGRLDLHLRPDFDRIDALVGLAMREATCCAFLSFSLSIGPGALTLVIEAPDDAARTLDQFAPQGAPHS